MKLNLYAAVALITATALISCAGTNESDYIDKSIIPPGSENKTAQPAEANAAIQNTGAVPANTSIIPGAATQPQPININPQNNVVTTSPQTMSTQPAAVAAGMNPAHGQPGHRCDIAVGAPLNSKPAPATAQPVAMSTQPQVTMKEIPNTQKTAPGMNPPHGEPGHRCDIAVGAPLNSKPAPATTQPTTVSTQPQVTTTTDAAPAQKTAPGMNPPHGQPNHRCDIAVGAPLNSKPVPPAATPVQTNTPPPLLTPAKPDSTKN